MQNLFHPSPEPLNIKKERNYFACIKPNVCPPTIISIYHIPRTRQSDLVLMTNKNWMSSLYEQHNTDLKIKKVKADWHVHGWHKCYQYWAYLKRLSCHLWYTLHAINCLLTFITFKWHTFGVYCQSEIKV